MKQLYEVMFTREVTTTDYFVRYIRADSIEAAKKKAEEIANAADSDCPDDSAESDTGNFECGSWDFDTLFDVRDKLPDDMTEEDVVEA